MYLLTYLLTYVQGDNYYIVLCSPLVCLFVDTETGDLNDLEWSFCVKIWFELDIPRN